MSFRILLALLFMIFSQAIKAQEQCVDKDPTLNKVVSNALEIRRLLCLPKISYDFKIDSSCVFNMSTTVEILNKDMPASPHDFIYNGIFNPSVQLSSADQTVMEKFSMKQRGNTGIYDQTVKGKKKGISAVLKSVCQTTKNTQSEASVHCVAEPMKVLFVKPFEWSENSVTCKNVNAQMKRCTFSTRGKFNSIPTVGGSCENGISAGREALNASYRLAYYLTHGDVLDLERGQSIIQEFYEKVDKNPGAKKGNSSFAGPKRVK